MTALSLLSTASLLTGAISQQLLAKMDTPGPSRIVVIVGEAGVQTDLDLDTLGQEDMADAMPYLLADYKAKSKDWTLLAGEHWRQGRYDRAEELMVKGISCASSGIPISLHSHANLSQFSAERTGVEWTQSPWSIYIV
jgi:hypothetical protein